MSRPELSEVLVQVVRGRFGVMGQELVTWDHIVERKHPLNKQRDYVPFVIVEDEIGDSGMPLVRTSLLSQPSSLPCGYG